MHIVITWPKKHTLGSYLANLEHAVETDQVINYRVANKPKTEAGQRCFIVYDGLVRGFNQILSVEWRGDVLDPRTQEFMREGWYVVRDPQFFPLAEPHAMQGFRGFRYCDAHGRARPSV